MKTNLFTLFFVLFGGFVQSQEWSFTTGPNWGAPFYYQFVAGGPGKTSKTGFDVNAEYVFADKGKKFSQGFGLSLMHSRVKFTSAFTGDPADQFSYNASGNILAAYYKFVFRKRNSSSLSVNPLIGLHLNKMADHGFPDQTGLGFYFGYAKKLSLGEKTFLKIEPRFTVFNVLPFAGFDLPERLTTIGINAGLGFSK